MQSSNVLPASGSTPVVPQASPAKSAQPSPDPSAYSSQAAPGSVQFETQLLVALLNAPQGLSITQPQPSLASGQMPRLAQFIPPDAGHLQPGCVAIGSSAGNLTPAELQGQSATSLASDLVSTFGSNGSLSESQINQVFMTGATAPASVLQDITRGIDADWNVLSGGSSTMSATQLASAIQQYLSVGSTNSSG